MGLLAGADSIERRPTKALSKNVTHREKTHMALAVANI